MEQLSQSDIVYSSNGLSHFPLVECVASTNETDQKSAPISFLLYSGFGKSRLLYFLNTRHRQQLPYPFHFVLFVRPSLALPLLSPCTCCAEKLQLALSTLSPLCLRSPESLGIFSLLLATGARSTLGHLATVAGILEHQLDKQCSRR